MTSRNSKIEPLQVQDILQGSTSSAKASPVEHVSTPSSPVPSGGSSGRTSFQSHSRAMSIMTDKTANGGPRTNRFSLSFPVQPSNSASPTRFSQSPTRESATSVPDALAALTGATDSNFLTAVAAQERRVLELKEELARAEADLTKLKRQWAHHEAQKKRDDAKSQTKLQPLQTSLPTNDMEDDSDGSSAWMQQEMERRKALMSTNRSSTRTVFSGSKHARTLSLLSPVGRVPDSAAPIMRPPPRPPRKESLDESTRRSQEAEVLKPRPLPVTRSMTTPDLMEEDAETAESSSESAAAAVDRELLIKQGKKMATDLRDGLWTFWEDLRQATVGEEGTQVPPPPPRRQSSSQTLRTAKKQGSKSSLRPSSRGSSTTTKASTEDKRPTPGRLKHTKSATMSLASTPALADPAFWSDHGLLFDQKPSPATVKKVGTAARHTKSPSKVSSITSSDNETWDAWDIASSPQASRSSSNASESATLPSTVSDVNSPRMSTDTPVKAELARSGEKSSSTRSNKSSDIVNKDPIPWPALSSLGPKALRRTASHLMAEWEKSLTPSPTKDYTGAADDYLGLGAEAAAAALPSERKMN